MFVLLFPRLLLTPAVSIIALVSVGLVAGRDARLSEPRGLQSTEELTFCGRPFSQLLFVLTLARVSVLLFLLLLRWRPWEEAE